jgi:hypothetical protein
LAAARAAIFVQMVDDPPSNADLLPTEKAQEKERQRLFEADQCRHTLEYLGKSKADPSLSGFLCAEA